MSKTARFLITMDCNRACKGCCNTYEPIMRHAVRIPTIEPLQGFDEIMITGGEPMLYPEMTKDIITRLWMQTNRPLKIFLYTATFHPMLKEIASMVNGIHFTLHHPYTVQDAFGFQSFQDMALNPKFDKCSFRCYIDPTIKEEIRIRPNAWKRLEVKPWIESGDCELPENNLFILDDEA